MNALEFRGALKAVGLRQIELAHRLGLAPTTVSRWARSEVPVPQYAIAYLELLGAQRAANEGSEH